MEIVDLMKEGDMEKEGCFKECIKTIETVISAQTVSGENYEQGGHISLQDEVHILEAALLEQKDLVKTEANTNEK